MSLIELGPSRWRFTKLGKSNVKQMLLNMLNLVVKDGMRWRQSNSMIKGRQRQRLVGRILSDILG